MLEMAALFVVAVHIQSVQPVFHTLEFIITASSQIPNFPEYLSVRYVDGVPITHCDSKSRKFSPKQDWMNKITAQDPDFWRRYTEICIHNQHLYKDNIKTVNERFNQSGGIHTIQIMYGCEWDDETGEVDGWEHYAYDGEDFISLDLKQWRWLTFKPQALVTKHKWEQQLDIQYDKDYLTKTCPDYLKMYLSNGKDFLTRTVLPRLSLLQKRSWSPVTCHATGFYPRDAILFWKKDGQKVSKGVEREDTLPNHDGTFQVSAHLRAADPGARYECVFQLAGVPDDIVVPLDDRVLLSNERIEAEERRKTALAVAVPLAVLVAVVIVAAIVYKWTKAKYATDGVHAEENEMSSPLNDLKRVERQALGPPEGTLEKMEFGAADKVSTKGTDDELCNSEKAKLKGSSQSSQSSLSSNSGGSSEKSSDNVRKSASTVTNDDERWLTNPLATDGDPPH